MDGSAGRNPQRSLDAERGFFPLFQLSGSGRAVGDELDELVQLVLEAAPALGFDGGRMVLLGLVVAVVVVGKPQAVLGGRQNHVRLAPPAVASGDDVGAPGLVADWRAQLCCIVAHSLDERPALLTVEKDMRDSVVVGEVHVAEGTRLGRPAPAALVVWRGRDQGDHHLAVAVAPSELAVFGRKRGRVEEAPGLLLRWVLPRGILEWPSPLALAPRVVVSQRTNRRRRVGGRAQEKKAGLAR